MREGLIHVVRGQDMREGLIHVVLTLELFPG